MTTLIALYDACVLYPAPLRDLLMFLAVEDIFQAKWSATIHEEWISNLLENHPQYTRAQLERTRQLMDIHVRDCLVEGYEHLIDGLRLPDPDDRHVLAAAIIANANVIVTFNLKDFPQTALLPHKIEAQHPDKFVANLVHTELGLVCAAIKKQRTNLKNPPKSVEEYLETLERQGLSTTVSLLRQYAPLL